MEAGIAFCQSPSMSSGSVGESPIVSGGLTHFSQSGFEGTDFPGVQLPLPDAFEEWQFSVAPAGMHCEARLHAGLEDFIRIVPEVRQFVPDAPDSTVLAGGVHPECLRAGWNGFVPPFLPPSRIAQDACTGIHIQTGLPLSDPDGPTKDAVMSHPQLSLFVEAPGCDDVAKMAVDMISMHAPGNRGADLAIRLVPGPARLPPNEAFQRAKLVRLGLEVRILPSARGYTGRTIVILRHLRAPLPAPGAAVPAARLDDHSMHIVSHGNGPTEQYRRQQSRTPPALHTPRLAFELERERAFAREGGTGWCIAWVGGRATEW